MNIEQKLEYIKSTVYHELGHLTGYCLASKFEDTDLGNVKTFEIGFPKNIVVPAKSFYHVEHDLLKEQERIKKETENIPRTIAWFIEVISGCTFQSIVEKKHFKSCFGPTNNFNGYLDFSNLAIVRNVSSFYWNFDELQELQSELLKTLIDSEFVQKLEPIVQKLLDGIKSAPLLQLKLKPSEIENLTNQINEIIPIKLLTDYKEIVNKYTFTFSKKADFIAELKYRTTEEGGRTTNVHSGYRPTIKFDFSDLQTSGSQRFIRRNFAMPGETVVAEINVASTDFLTNKLEKGTVFDFREGSRIIGFGTVIKVVNEDLELGKAST
ncbi:hypothetical protein [Olleya sp. HaHaR_3_96]|uniref:EF-Tu C-terminal domain-related protein n=1 Tax=Olleya sp. HaHaR_3_96 TaxID=2745560 RepID=UPI001C4E9C1E|nr:hypothetical protein [Olleya sp. HaHaR_3_96]QXP58184.1 hypothetical protein H0I26_09615 [Olleya sp. HaHaR_3_96]